MNPFDADARKVADIIRDRSGIPPRRGWVIVRCEVCGSETWAEVDAVAGSIRAEPCCGRKPTIDLARVL